MFKSVFYYVKAPRRIFRALGARGIFNWLSDERYLKYLYYIETGKKLNLENPMTYNEKLQWLKLYDRNDEYVDLVDKYHVRNYIKKKIGEEYLIPLLAVYDMPEEIEWDSLPSKFVVKCTHGSYSNIICKDKKSLDIEKSKEKLNKWMKKSWFWGFREWPYKKIVPKIIIEEYMVDESNEELKDYKLFCFDGKVHFIQVDFGRFTDHKRNIYDLNWNLLPVEIENPNSPATVIQKPENLDKMIEIAEILSAQYKHVRIDLYSIKEKIYFGEITFYHGGGFQKITPSEFELYMGGLIKLQ